MADSQWLSPGFSEESILNHLFKKSVYRSDTSRRTAYFKEPSSHPKYFVDYLATENIPTEAPTDFVTLTSAQVADLFKITEEEISEFSTYVRGVPTFSIEQSSTYPSILKINNLLLKPYQGSINSVFTAITPVSNVNLLGTVVPFSFGDGSYRGAFHRTMMGNELSMGGEDIVLAQQLAYIFDYETGFFVLHKADSLENSPNPIQAIAPPAVTCFIYMGAFGNLGWRLQNSVLFARGNQVVIGKEIITDPTLAMDVSGSAFIAEITARSVSTSSDARLKTNIRPATTTVGVLNVQPYHYSYKTNPDIDEYGVLAQEVERVFPEAVRTNGDGFKSVAYDRFGVALIPIVREQQETIEQLKKDIFELKKILASIRPDGI